MSVAPLPKVEQEPCVLCGYPKGAMNEVALENFKGLLQDGRRAKLLKTLRAPLPCIKTYQMTLFSARSISLDNTFNSCFHCRQPSLSLYMI
jgi:hypothetical protein